MVPPCARCYFTILVRLLVRLIWYQSTVPSAAQKIPTYVCVYQGDALIGLNDVCRLFYYRPALQIYRYFRDIRGRKTISPPSHVPRSPGAGGGRKNTRFDLILKSGSNNYLAEGHRERTTGWRHWQPRAVKHKRPILEQPRYL